MRVAAAEIVCVTGDVGGNLTQVAELSRRAASEGAEFILFAEAALTGYVPAVPGCEGLEAEGPEARALRALARELNLAIAVGTLERCGSARHVSHWVFLPDGRLVNQRKHRLAPPELAAGFVPGPRERERFVYRGLTFAILICADAGIDGIHAELSAAGTGVLLCPCAGGGSAALAKTPADLRDPAKFKEYAEAMERVCFVAGGADQNIRLGFAAVAVNLCGFDGAGAYHPGHSSIVDRTGRVAALRPGEYVAAWQRPGYILGSIWTEGE